MIAVIAAHRDQYRVESICEQLPIAPSTYCEYKARQIEPSNESLLLRRDREIKVDVERASEETFEDYGVRKVRRQLNCEEIIVSRCTVERPMRQLGLPAALRPHVSCSSRTTREK